MRDKIGNLREELHKAINLYGLEYDKVIEIDRKLHEEIIKSMREGNIIV